MKNPLTTFTRVAVAAMVLALLFSCKKGQNQEVSPAVDEGGVKTISLIGLKSDTGFSYKIGYNLPQTGDSQTQPTLSTLRLFENGVELGPAHSNHHSIRAYGQGQYSHWGTTLYFSASDNTNPLDNGRKYTYTMQ